MAVPLAAALLAGCGLFGGGRAEVSPEERALRVPMSVTQQQLAANPALADVTVTLPAPVELAEWPQSGGNSVKIAGHVDAGSAFRIAWRESVGAGSSRTRHVVAPPVVAGGRIFIIDADQRVSAFEEANGRRVWTRQLESLHSRDSYAVGGGLAVAGDKLIVTSGFGYVEAMNVATGEQVWRRRAESPLSGSPAVVGGRAFVTTTNNELYAIDVETGEVIWTDQAIAESARVLSSPSPAANDDILVAPFSSGELVAFLPANGRRLWADSLTTVGRFTPLSAINDIAGRPSIEAGVVYAGSHSGVIAAIDARSGQRLWAQLFGSRLGPVIAGPYIFAVGTNGQVVCLDKTDGRVIWVRALPEFRNPERRRGRLVWTGPLVASNRLIVASSDGEVVALSPQTGETLDELKVGDAIYVEPIAAAGRIYVLTDAARLIAID
ncbi:PQQ-binding-like beta-propeller repeat protein [bacterium]|nr:PQQ-binding-like beta-propeller repeat protein [bacterium]